MRQSKLGNISAVGIISGHTCSTYNIVLDSDGTLVVLLDHLFLRIGTIWIPLIRALLIVRERVKWDACSTKFAVAVDFVFAFA
jgi:hypothetical protein